MAFLLPYGRGRKMFLHCGTAAEKKKKSLLSANEKKEERILIAKVGCFGRKVLPSRPSAMREKLSL